MLKSLRILWYKMRIRNQAMETVSACAWLNLLLNFRLQESSPEGESTVMCFFPSSKIVMLK